MSQKTLTPDYQLLEQIEAVGPFQTGACFQCRKCTNGCPVTFAMDFYPDEVIRMVILGQRQAVLSCQTIWVCAACATCTTRCPNDVKIAELMDALKEMALGEGVPAAQPRILALHESFLNNIKKRGRLHETTLLPSYWLKSGTLLDKWNSGAWRYDLKLGHRMLSKGRLPLMPKSIKGKWEVREILARQKGSTTKTRRHKKNRTIY
ncbi:MAG: 4Fe-4S dicluster domain-containing protein [Desulfobacterales bacterium]|jgi:heterodisulfide reductase subunit C